MARFLAPLTLLATLALALPAAAQTPRDIQNLITSGQPAQAVQDLQGVIQAHPTSGEAWYLLAEAQDALGHEQDAGAALSKAEQVAPGLPFANPQDVTALQAHIGTAPASTPDHSGSVLGIIAGLIVALFAFGLLMRRRAASPGYAAPPYGYNAPQQGGYYAPQQGGGFLSSLFGGLVAGAGFAAGERIVDGMLGGNNGQANADTPSFTDTNRDDGLMGDPGWDNSSSGDSGGGDSW
jgi:hypothetical protein